MIKAAFKPVALIDGLAWVLMGTGDYYSQPSRCGSFMRPILRADFIDQKGHGRALLNSRLGDELLKTKGTRVWLNEPLRERGQSYTDGGLTWGIASGQAVEKIGSYLDMHRLSIMTYNKPGCGTEPNSTYAIICVMEIENDALEVK